MRPETPAPLRTVRLFAAGCAGMFVFGVVLALLGTLFGLPEMRLRMRVDLAQQGNLFFLLFLGVCSSTLAAGPLIDNLGHKLVLLWSSLLVMAGLLGFVAARSPASASIAAVLIGVGGGGLNTAANVLVSDLYAHNRGPMMNLLGMFYGVGALFVPFLVASIAGTVSMTAILVATAALPAMCAVVYGVFQFPQAREAHGMSRSELMAVLRYPGLLVFAALLFFESGNEAALGGWASSYVGSQGASERTATWILSGYWLALIVGRFLVFKILARASKTTFVLLTALGSAASCALLLWSRSVASAAAAVMLAGLTFAGIYPTVLALAGDRYPRYSGTVFGVLFAVGLAGGAVFPLAVGQISQVLRLRAGMLVPLAGTMAVAVLAAIVRQRSSTA
jgi:MFS transporter, FHS family, glucose/mannose:H+ symporter